MIPHVRRRLRALVVAAIIAVTIPVSGCGTTNPDHGLRAVVNVPADATTLNDALAAVAPGGIIFVAPGVYDEQLVINKDDVTIRGTDRNLTIVDGGGVRPYGIVAVADGVRIENLTVRNTTFYGVLVTGLFDDSGPSAHTANGYEAFDPEAFPPVDRFAINYVTAHNNGLYGIYAFNATHGVITNSYASGSADSGFYVGQCADCDILVEGNVAERNAVGFENANASRSLTIVGNRFSGNRVGLTLISNYQEAFTPQSANLVAGNVISDNAGADSPRQESGGFGIGVGVSGGIDNVFAYNLIEGNPRAGVLLANTEDLPAAGNRFLGNLFGGNGVDFANVSADRAPASGNCPDLGAVVTALPTELLAPCANAADADQPAALQEDLPGPAAPDGVSFLQVSAPVDQPGMPDADTIPSLLPATIDRPRLNDVLRPAANLLVELTGSR